VLKYGRIAGDIFFIPVLLAEVGVGGLNKKSKLTAQFISAWSIL